LQLGFFSAVKMRACASGTVSSSSASANKDDFENLPILFSLYRVSVIFGKESTSASWPIVLCFR
jgi:hypothetical protein